MVFNPRFAKEIICFRTQKKKEKNEKLQFLSKRIYRYEHLAERGSNFLSYLNLSVKIT